MAAKPKHVVSAKAALKAAEKGVDGELEKQRRARAAEEATRAEWEKPENVRARLVASIKKAAADLPALLEKANVEFAKKIDGINSNAELSPGQKALALEEVQKLTMTSAGKVMNAELKARPVEDPSNVYLSFNNGTFLYQYADWNWDGWTDLQRLNKLLSDDKVKAETQAIRAFMGACKKHNIGVKVSLMPAGYHRYEAMCEGNWVEDRRNAGVFVQVFPMQDFNPDLLPQALVPPKPRTPRPDTAAGVAAPEPAPS